MNTNKNYKYQKQYFFAQTASYNAMTDNIINKQAILK